MSSFKFLTTSVLFVQPLMYQVETFGDLCVLSFKASSDPLSCGLPHLCRMVLIVTFGATYATSHAFSGGYTRILDAQLLMFGTICMPFN